MSNVGRRNRKGKESATDQIEPRNSRDLLLFAHHLIESEDVDPIYPVLRHLYREMDDEPALWFTFLYCGYYNITSALAAWERHRYTDFRKGAFLNAMLRTFPCAVERRGMRGGQITRYIESYAELTRLSQRGWIQSRWTDDPLHNYEEFWQTAQTVWGNGRWAAFKWAEILRKVHGFNLIAPDMRLKDCSGPREGLGWLKGDDEIERWKALNIGNTRVPELEKFAAGLRAWLAGRGLSLDWETLETVLCNFNSLRKGHYYVGHDIDEMQDQIINAEVYCDLSRLRRLWDARRAALPVQYLGEAGGWVGIQKELLKLYSQKGAIYCKPCPHKEFTSKEWA